MGKCTNKLNNFSDEVLSLLSAREDFNYSEIAEKILSENVTSAIYFSFKEFRKTLNDLKETFATIDETGEILVDENGENLPFLFDEELLIKAVREKVSNDYKLNPVKDNKPLFDFTNNIATYKTNSIRNYVQSYLYNEVFKFSFINNGPNVPIKDVFVFDNDSLNRNIVSFKNRIWKTLSDKDLYIVNPEKKALQLNKEVFDTGLYYDVLSKVKENFDNLSNYVVSDKTVKDYINAIIIANFDNLIKEELGDILSVKYHYTNSYSPTSEKYTLEFKPLSGISYDKDTSENSGIEKHTSSFIKYFAETIPFTKFGYVDSEERGDNDNIIIKKDWESVVVNSTPLDAKLGIKTINAISSLFSKEGTIVKLNKTRGTNKTTIEDHTIADLFRMLDNNEITFQRILETILDTFANDPDTLSSLYLHRDGIASIYKYLYKGGYSENDERQDGLMQKYREYLFDVPQNRSLIINPELALVNYIKANVTNVYRFESLVEHGRSVDALNFDANYNEVIANMYQQFYDKWVAKEAQFSKYVIKSVPEFLNDFGDYDLKGFGNFKGAQVNQLNQLITGEILDVEDGKKRFFTLEEFSDKIQKFFNQEIYKAIKDKIKTEIINVVTNIQNKEGNNLPTVSIYNLISAYQRVLADAKQREYGRKNLLVEKSNLIKYFEVSEEVELEEGSVSTFTFNGKENFTLAFTRHFLSSLVNPDLGNKTKLLVQPWNFSDKSKLYLAHVDPSVFLNDSGKNINNTSSLELQKVMFDYQNTYFTGLIDNVFLEYLKLKEFVEMFDKNHKWSATTAHSLNQISQTEKIQKINKFLDINGGKMEELIRKNFNNDIEYSKLKESTPATEFVKTFLTKPNFVEELHYSKYTIGESKKIVFSKYIEKLFETYSDFNKFIKWSNSKEKSLVNYTKDIHIKVSALGIVNDSGKISTNIQYVTKKIKEAIGVDVAFDSNNEIILSENGQLTEIGKKYLWSKNLIISQYANLTTKDVYQHPQKKIELNLNKDGNIEYTDENFLDDENERSIPFTKRMVISGASMTPYGKDSSGVLPKIKVAVFSDINAHIFNYTNDRYKEDGDKMDALDGSAYANPYFAEFTRKSLPGTGLSRVQKPIGTSNNDFNSTLLKFASYGINNELMRRSIGNTLNLRTVVQKMTNIPFEIDDIFKLNNIGTTLDILKIFDDVYVPINGKYRKIESVVSLGNKQYTVYYQGIKEPKSYSVNTIDDMFEMFGACFTKNNNGEWTDDSIKIVTSIIEQNEADWLLSKDKDPSKRMKDKMICLACQKSAMKNGVTNLNSTSTLWNKEQILYFDYDTTNFGIQLDATHLADDATVNEVTQIISAIAQHNTTDDYLKTYEALSDIVETSIEELFGEKTTDDYRLKQFTKAFINTIQSSQENATGKEVLEILNSKTNLIIPFSNRSFYKPFISSVISKLNTDFIRRKFSGIAAVINPSFGSVQIYEDKDGNTYFSEDLVKNIFNEDTGKTYEENYHNRLQKALTDSKFANDPVELSQVNPLDWILYEGKDLDGNIISEEFHLDSYDKYYNFKRNYIDGKYYKIYNKPRDLKPVEITFKENDIIQNVWDLPAFVAKYDYLNDIENPQLKEFIEKFNLLNDKEIKLYLNRWIQRTFEILAQGFNYSDNVSEMFENDDLTSRFDLSKVVNKVPITIESYKDAENILPKIHSSQFDLTNKNVADIDINFFKSKIKKSVLPNKKSIYDVVLTDYNRGNNAYILLKESARNYEVKSDGIYLNGIFLGKTVISDIKAFEEKTTIKDELGNNVSGILTKYYRMDNRGNKMYEVSSPEFKVFRDNFGNEIIYDSIDNIKTLINTSKKLYSLVNVNDMFTGDIIQLYSLVLKTNLNDENKTYLRRKFEVIKEDLDKQVDITQDLRFVEYNRHYIDKIANMLFGSYKMSLYSIASRIPGQSLQSMMSMKTVGYTEDTSNNCYVSHWQLYIQGSDLDIDKTYFMTYSFNKGVFDTWSPLFDFKYLDASLQLPFPNRSKKYNNSSDYFRASENSNSVWDGDLAYLSWLKLHKEEKPPIVEFYVQSLNYLNSHPKLKGIKIAKNWIFDAINDHNSYQNENGSKNYIVKNLIKTSRNLENQIASYTPVSFGDLDVQKIREYSLGLYDGHTMGIQQYQNAIGKDVIGIGATGLKDYFAMLTAYAKTFSKSDYNHDSFSNPYFEKLFTLNGKKYLKYKIGGLNLDYSAQSMLQESVKQSLINEEFEFESSDGTVTKRKLQDDEIDNLIKLVIEEDPAVKLSAVISAATDNAKQLILAKINCGKDFASMYIYLLILGFSEKDIVSFMTSEKITNLTNKLQNNVFLTKRTFSIDSRLTKRNITEKLGITYDSDIKQFVEIYKLSKELTFLGSLLKINQGNKGTEEEIYKFNSRLVNGFCNQEKEFFGKIEIDKFSQKEDKTSILNSMTNKIMEKKPHLTDKTKILEILTKAQDIIGAKFSADLFYTNDEYRKNATDYYNLIKGTFNVLDIIQQVPHFYSMSRSFYYGEKEISRIVYKYNWTTRVLPKLLKIGIEKGELKSNAIFKNISYFSNPNNPIDLDESIMNRGDDFYDDQMILEWLKTSKLQISLQGFLSFLDKDSIKILNTDLKEDGTKDYTLSDVDEILDLSSASNIAQFRFLMETYLIPKMKKSGNEFLSEFIKKKTGNYNMKKQVNFYQDIWNFEKMNLLDSEVLRLINNSDEFQFPLLKTGENISNIEYVDLLFLYNLIINKDRYGGDRATMFFNQYILKDGSLAQSFYNFQNEQDSDGELMDKLEENIEDADFRNLVYFSLFSKTLKNGVRIATIKVDKSEDAQIDEEMGIPVDKKIEIKNKYYTLFDKVENTVTFLAENIEAQSKKSGTIWNLEC